MRRMRIIGVSLVAVFAIGVMASTASAAQPVFYGVAELGKVVATPIKQAGTLGPAFLEGKTSKGKITCTGGTSTGEVTGPTKSANNIATFTGCETNELKCNSAGQPTGTIQTNKMDGVLGNVSATLPGVRLFKEGEGGKVPKTGALATFECGAGLVKVVVTGSVIGSLSGAAGNTPEEGKFATSSKITFAEALGAQKYTKFLAGQCGGNANDCGPEQLTSKIHESEELGGQSVIATLKTVPFAGKLGYTK